MSKWNRDSQRQKVYNAESAWERQSPKRENVTLQEAQEWLDLLAITFGVGSVTIKRNSNIRQFSGWYKRYARLIEVPGIEVGFKTLLHEFGHHLDDERQGMMHPDERRRYTDPGHGAQFTECMLDIVEHVYGHVARQALHKEYEARRCMIGRQEAIDRIEKRAAAAEARNRRIGQTGTVYIVGQGLADWPHGQRSWADGDHWASHPDNAKAYRTLKAAKRAARWFSRATIFEVDGVYKRPYHWWTGEAETPVWQVTPGSEPRAIMEFRPVKPGDPTTGWQEVTSQK